jgi:hypothetical protein
MNRKNPLGSGFLFLLVAGAVGYGIGLGLDLVISGTGRPDFTAPVPSAFTLLFAFTAFFFGVYGYRGITRGLVYQVLGTFIGGFIVTGIRALMGLSPLFGNSSLLSLHGCSADWWERSPSCLVSV